MEAQCSRKRLWELIWWEQIASFEHVIHQIVFFEKQKPAAAADPHLS
jgi:hypothetical protein